MHTGRRGAASGTFRGMRESDKKSNKGSDLGVLAERAASSALGDRSSDKMRKAASAVGNEELQQRISKGNANRDDLLEFIVTRLRTVRDVQEKELGLTSTEQRSDWWRKVGDKGKEEYSKPDPTQWIEVARMYEEASYQVCRGALGRGKQLVERAMDAEKKKMGDLTKLVDTKNIDDKNVESPSVMGRVGESDACSAADVPAEIKDLTHKIESVTAVAGEAPNRKRVRDPWWTLEEEEEEEEGGGGGD